jgi:hypothetical protein
MGEKTKIGTICDSRSLYEATVAVAQWLQDDSPRNATSGFFSMNARVAYDGAVRRGLAPKRPSMKQQESFLAQRREFALVESEKGRSGVLGLGRPLYSFQVLISDVCVTCGGEVDWEYSAADSRSEFCDERRVCKQCGSVPTLLARRQSGLRHDFHDDLQAAERCQARKVCSRCGYSSVTTRHTYADWRYDGEDSCGQTRACTGCGNVETRVAHVGEWQDVPSKTQEVSDGFFVYYERRTCSRCGNVEERSDLSSPVY